MGTGSAKLEKVGVATPVRVPDHSYRAEITVTLPDTVTYVSYDNGKSENLTVKSVSLTSDRLQVCTVRDAGTDCGDYVDRGGSHPVYVSANPVQIDLSTGHLSQVLSVNDRQTGHTMTFTKSAQCDVAELKNALAMSDREEPNVQGLVVEESKPERPRSGEKLTIVDVYYACEARDTSGEKPIFYYSNVADIKMPKNFGFPEDIKIRKNWREYITKATGATDDPTCAPLSIHSMDEALRKQREIVSNRSVYNETVSVNYDPHL